MKKIVKYVTVLIIILLVSVNVFAQVDSKNNQNNTIRFQSQYSALNDLKESFNKGADEEEIIQKVVDVTMHMEEYDEQTLISEIADGNSPVGYRVALLQTLDEVEEPLESSSTKELRKMLQDKNVEFEVKRSIIVENDFDDEEGIQLLSEIANGDNDDLAFQAIKKLYRIDEEQAVDIVNKILQNYQYEQPEKINIMLKTLSQEYYRMRVDGVDQNKREAEEAFFLKVCANIINNYEDFKLRDAAVFALSDMTEPKAISEIVTNPNIDTELKVYAIDQNYLTLKGMIKSGENVNVVCQAMEIYPIKELQQDLIAMKEDMEPITSLDENHIAEASVLQVDEEITTDTIDKAIDEIQRKGNDASQKWIDLYNGGAY